ncbi:uncharacterized protein LOC110060115 [Orbicella faveolata]|uniref:uncharacterized protein LOC110060115 n=1 Tax=Orbicella faveolata TaxID=48498 RepID=UPI0009E3C810|nr:uncharacterized protein LOC110060115 [Orbicella faveolata]XP_020622526.1 uncharacterized protein LOC110060115 [Orbicella faveolata]
MEYFLFVIFVLLSSTSGNPVYKRHDERKESHISPQKVVDLTAHVGEAGQEYNENMEVDPNKRTELFEVAAHPGVDRSDALHDFKPASISSSQDVEDLPPKREKRQYCLCGVHSWRCCRSYEKIEQSAGD